MTTPAPTVYVVSVPASTPPVVLGTPAVSVASSSTSSSTFPFDLSSPWVLGAVGAAAVATASYLGLRWYSRPASVGKIPSTSRAVIVNHIADIKSDKFDSALTVKDVPTPVPKWGQVLIRVERSPINPSDLMTLQGMYNPDKRLPPPHGAGYEGSGTVVQSGGGFFAKRLLGKHVACATEKPSMWSEYVVVDALRCIPFPDGSSFDQTNSSFVNPLTALAFVHIAKERRLKSILHTAGASALGKMLARLCIKNHIALIAVVRREDQKEVLVKLGVPRLDVINTSDVDWQKQLTARCKAHECVLGFDAVGSTLIGEVLHCMPAHAEVQSYGRLAEGALGGLDAIDLIFRGKKVTGFWLSPFLGSLRPWAVPKFIGQVPKLLKTDLQTDVSRRFPLSQVTEAVKYYSQNMTSGKVLIAPTLSEAQ